MSTPASKSISLEPSTITEPKIYQASRQLPDEPLVIIQRGSALGIFDLRELWAYRELLYFLTWRDLKVRYKQTVFGVAWAVLQPVLMTLIFTVFLGMLARVPTGGVPYPLLVYCGLLPWTFFSSAILGSAQSLIANANLITKVYFPRVLSPAATVAARLVDFAFSFLILAGLVLYYRLVLNYPIVLTWNLAALPLMVLLLTSLIFGLGMLVSSINVKYRDVGVALPVLIQLWMFVSPVVYPASLVPEKWRTLYSMNPLVGVIQGFRAALLNQPFPLFALGISTVFTIVLLVIASIIFRRNEKSFADNI
jgi:lipopolysaccharide transport system permease protein